MPKEDYDRFLNLVKQRQDFRTDEQVLADVQKTWDWCMSEH
jgi:hypothetical protein